MEYRVLEITVQYAKDLNKVNLITKMDVYANVSVSSSDEPNSSQSFKTPVDHDGDANPTWNFPISYTVDESALQQNRLTLNFQIISKRALGDKNIGELHLPVKKLFDTPVKCSASGKSFVSYYVLKPSGKPKGSITFSYKFRDKISTGPVEPSAPPLEKKDYVDPVVTYSGEPSYGYQSCEVNAGGGYLRPPAYGAPAVPLAYGYSSSPSYVVVPAYTPQYGYNPSTSYGGAPVYSPHYYPVQPARKKNKLGLGLGAGLLGGLLLGDLMF